MNLNNRLWPTLKNMPKVISISTKGRRLQHRLISRLFKRTLTNSSLNFKIRLFFTRRQRRKNTRLTTTRRQRMSIFLTRTRRRTNNHIMNYQMRLRPSGAASRRHRGRTSHSVAPLRRGVGGITSARIRPLLLNMLTVRNDNKPLNAIHAGRTRIPRTVKKLMILR